MMFKQVQAFSSFSVNDPSRAKQFYGEILGMDIRPAAGMEEMGLFELQVAGSRQPLLVYPKPDHQPATFTILNFLVEDIDVAVDELAARGIALEKYDNPDMPQDDKGIMRAPQLGIRQAWFKDPAGNVLSIIQSQITRSHQ